MVRRGRTVEDARQVERNAAAAGVRVQVAPDPDTEVWPENWMPMQVVMRMATQWTISPMGQRMGLRYEAMPVVERALGIPPAERADVFFGVQMIEAEVIKAMGERNG